MFNSGKIIAFAGDSQRSDDLELAAHLTASQTATVRRRLASLQGTLSKASSQQILEGETWFKA